MQGRCCKEDGCYKQTPNSSKGRKNWKKWPLHHQDHTSNAHNKTSSALSHIDPLITPSVFSFAFVLLLFYQPYANTATHSVFYSYSHSQYWRQRLSCRVVEMSASKLTIIVVVLLHLIAFGLAVAAERRRSTGKRTSDEYDEKDYCVYDSDIASWYGTGAIIFLLFSQALVMATTGCLCCGSALRPGGHRSCSIVLFLFSWICFLIAEACFVGGSLKNAYHTKYNVQFGLPDLSCASLRKGVFATGAAFTFVNMIVSPFFITNFSKARSTDGWKPYPHESSVAMGTL